MHVLKTVRPATLRDVLKFEFAFSHHELQEGFRGFLKYAHRLAEAFPLLDIGPKPDRATALHNNKPRAKSNHSGDNDSTKV